VAFGGGEGKPSIGELFRKYGVVGLAFHFTVWVSCLAIVYALLSGNVDISWVLERLPGGGALGDAGEAAGKLGATLAVTEATGPLRIGLTVAATPRIAKALPQNVAQFLRVAQDDEKGEPEVVGRVEPVPAVAPVGRVEPVPQALRDPVRPIEASQEKSTVNTQ
jgi:hypothetical protein